MTEAIVDGHNDLLLRLWEADDPVAAFAEGGGDTHVDLPRAREAGLAAGLFAAFVPGDDGWEAEATPDGYEYSLPDAIDPERARKVTYELLAVLHRLAAETDLRVVRTPSDLDACVEGGEVGAVAHLEGAAGVAPDLSNLDLLYAAGVRSIGPVWSRPNAFGHGVAARYPGDPDTGPGLTDAGRALVRACEEKGILVDAAHLTEQGFWDVAAALDGPFTVSHTGAHAVCPHSRNLTDEQLAAVADAGGVVGVTFGEFCLADAPDPSASATVADFAEHVAYVADRVGVEHVAVGSDFDGATIPDGIGDVTGLPGVLDALRDHGLSDRDVERVARDNWRRLLGDVL